MTVAAKRYVMAYVAGKERAVSVVCDWIERVVARARFGRTVARICPLGRRASGTKVGACERKTLRAPGRGGVSAVLARLP